MERILDVGLRGTRNYVQGSQILARTAEIVAADHPHALLTSAKFTRITLKGVRLVVGDGDGADEIGRATFDDGGTRIVARFLEIDGPDAPRIDDVPPSTSGLEADAAGAGSAGFAIAGGFESYLAAVIECVKAIHAQRGEQVSDIWFTALAQARLPVAPAYPTTGVLTVTPKLARMVGERLQTLSLVDTEGKDAPPRFQILFSCVVAG